MAKGKNLNPADAYRKSLRKKELKKNKAERAKAREFALVKKDTRDLEEDIGRLEAASELSSADESRLTELKSELEAINNKKEEYVKEHPEHRKLVYRARRSDTNQEGREEVILQKRNLFKQNGLPRHPERSIYYDPVMNPFGVPPPGMPYIERPLRPDEIQSDNDEDDDDIVMPEGPPPSVKQEDGAGDSDDDIPMPEGPPPPEAQSSPGGTSQYPPVPVPNIVPPEIPTTSTPDLEQMLQSFQPPFPPLPPLPLVPPFSSLPPSSSAPGPWVGYRIPPPPPPPHPYVPFAGLSPSHYPVPPPPPPPGFSLQSMPPPPPGFFSRRQQSISSMQDPLSTIPHETFQAHRARQLVHPSLPANPALASSGTKQEPSTTHAAATVSAEPQLRDLKKEATAFVPTSLKRKRPGASSASTSKVNAAPSLGPEVVVSEQMARPDLLSTLKNQIGVGPGSSTHKPAESKAAVSVAKDKDDYQKFVEGMGDLLGPAK